ncbi:MAG: glucose-6-phosphate dehydrogenase assembly protein OpcA [Solirubrobacterales bacterium]|nr:glucose-6-phosphate dehydrogenase assembly protein OpcA [Solirubrobacterales bacterium]
MTEDVWADSNTSPEAIAGALRGMLHERHTQSQSLAPARVLNLVVVVDREWKGEISNRLARVGRYQASRTILCAVEEGRTTLDGRAVMSFEESGEGPGIVVEQIEIDIGPDRLAGLESVIDPVVVSEIPTMLWSPHGHDEAVHALLGLIDVLLLDSDQLLEPEDSLAYAAEMLRSAYVVDLAWLRTTPWRERLAASFDPPSRLPLLGDLSELRIRHQETSSACAMLLAGWLASRLGWEASSLAHEAGEGWVRGEASRNGDRVSVELERAEQNAPGLAGVEVKCGDQYSLSLDRGRGGLQAHERVGSDESRWRVLGASRGEGGILGEGVRQALLRDPTYGPALGAAREFAGV